MTGDIIQVKGYADSSGNAIMNQELSMDRAQAVIAYLLQNCKILSGTSWRPGRWAKRIRQLLTRPPTGERKTAVWK